MEPEIPKPKPKRNMHSFEAEDDVEEMLQRAQGSGLKITEIMNTAVRASSNEIEEMAKSKANRLSTLSFRGGRDGNSFQTETPQSQLPAMVKQFLKQSKVVSLKRKKKGGPPA